MGIKDLRLILDTVSYVKNRSKISKFCGSNIAVDISGFVYRYVRSMGDRWVEGLISVLCLLKKYGMHVVCVFDGKNAPIEKTQTRIERRAGTDSVKDKLQELLDVQEKIYVEYYGTEIDLPEDIISNIKYLLGRQRKIKENPDRPFNYKDPIAMHKLLQNIRESWAKQVLDITDDHMTPIKELIDILGFSQIQASGEAETVCAFLWKIGVVNVVYSEDSDILAYGVEHFISKIDTKSEEITYIHSPTLYRELNMTHEQFVDLCIMCGCDYNKRIYKCGPATSLKLIYEYGSLEEIEKLGKYDMDCLNYKKCRQLLKIPSYIQEKVIKPQNYKLNKEGLANFLKKNKCRLRQKDIEQYWEPIKIIINEVCSPQKSLGKEDEAENSNEEEL